jgi:pimeloyl-ACP methyl ester carboxylesterase
MREEAVLFGKAENLVGVITEHPEAESGSHHLAIILLSAGLVHRVGPNRLYVKMARHFAGMGFAVLRFDFSGIGDSEVCDDQPFEQSAVSETQQAMDFLSATRGIERFVLVGICAGADISFQAACRDPRVVGTIPINAQDFQLGMSEDWSDSITDRKDARYYWKRSLYNPKSWLNAITGKADYRTIIRVVGFRLTNLFARRREVSPETAHITAGFHALVERGVFLLLVYTEGDLGLGYFEMTLDDEVKRLSASGKLRIEIIPQTDHIFTLLQSQERLLKVTQDWVQVVAPP